MDEESVYGISFMGAGPTAGTIDVGTKQFYVLFRAVSGDRQLARMTKKQAEAKARKMAATSSDCFIVMKAEKVFQASGRPVEETELSEDK